MRPLIPLASVIQAGLGREEPEYDDRDGIAEEVVGVITAVYPIDHPENGLGQTLVDVQVGHLLPAWKRVPLGATHAHGETERYVENSRRRQPYDPKERNQMEGAVYDVRPGTRVLVRFPSKDLRSPTIVGILKYNRQGKGGFPAEKQGVDRWKDGKLLDMVEVNPLDSARAEYPRAVDTYNGTRLERDNRGNFSVQTTIDRASVFPGHNGIPAAPDPEGNIALSTRGARVGNVGITTGKHPLTDDDSRGSIRFETAKALVGDLIARLRSGSGRFFVSTKGSDDGRVFLVDKDGDYVALRANGNAELHGESKAVLDSDDVRLGHDGAPYEIVLWPQLDIIMTQLCNVFDSHGHTEVESGSSVSGPPNNFQTVIWERQREDCRADGVKADKSPSASPEQEEDPDD